MFGVRISVYMDQCVVMQRALAIWILDPAERDARLANEATKMLTHSNFVLMEIACTRSSHHLFKVRQTYHLLYKKSLEEDIAHHTSGDFRKVSDMNSNIYLVLVERWKEWL